MSDQIPHDYSKQDVIDWANWLMAEDAYFNNWIRSAMYEKQTELIGQLDDAREWNDYLVRVYSELQVPASDTSKANAMVLDIAMELAEIVKTLSRAPRIPGELAASGHDEVPMHFDFVRVDNAIDELTRITRYLNVTGKSGGPKLREVQRRIPMDPDSDGRLRRTRHGSFAKSTMEEGRNNVRTHR
jgi:hypothetical protein